MLEMIFATIADDDVALEVMIVKWAAVGLVETVVISLVGAWIYRD